MTKIASFKYTLRAESFRVKFSCWCPFLEMRSKEMKIKTTALQSARSYSIYHWCPKWKSSNSHIENRSLSRVNKTKWDRYLSRASDAYLYWCVALNLISPVASTHKSWKRDVLPPKRNGKLQFRHLIAQRKSSCSVTSYSIYFQW